ncbi:hypothetical protein GCM10025751_16920 [Haladaptatus pallidirubidus]|uniref:Uncharacterized protein n=1 Tax=Haladaptatus pallidirubidus TaxID=1008152 RepID=A0AAV3UF24_9EURY
MRRYPINFSTAIAPFATRAAITTDLLLAITGYPPGGVKDFTTSEGKTNDERDVPTERGSQFDSKIDA